MKICEKKTDEMSISNDDQILVVSYDGGVIIISTENLKEIAST